MKNNKWLTVAIVISLALVMVWTVPSLAQMRGQGQGGPGWGCGQGPGQGQGYGRGYGPGAAAGTCPNYQNYPISQGTWSNDPQYRGPSGPRGAGRYYQPNTQPSAPPVTR